MTKIVLSILILNYNTKDLLEGCLKSLIRVKKEVDFEVIVVDNGSTDGSVTMIESLNSQLSTLKLIKNKKNLGFAAGNNRARKYCKGKYVLFLNSDTIVNKNTLKECVAYMEKNRDVGAVTCKAVLPSGDLDKDARRSFITPWIGLVHIFLKLDRLFPKSKIFGQYWYGYISPDKVHEVDVIQGAFFMTRKALLDKVEWLDEDYFLDGEDIDLSWKIMKEGWKRIYYPKVSIVHLKGATKGKNATRFSETGRKVTFSEKMKYKMSGVNSMEIFIRKRLWNEYPLPLMIFVVIGIKILKLLRIIGLLVTG
jgi:GT2 family glycosyltransferase